jgi:hypothetical protein
MRLAWLRTRRCPAPELACSKTASPCGLEDRARVAHELLRRLDADETLIRSHAEGDDTRFYAIAIFVPDGQVRHFVQRFGKYALTTPKRDRERRYEDMGDRIAAVRLATLRALWTDDAAAYPHGDQDNLVGSLAAQNRRARSLRRPEPRASCAWAREARPRRPRRSRMRPRESASAGAASPVTAASRPSRCARCARSFRPPPQPQQSFLQPFSASKANLLVRDHRTPEPPAT